MKRDKHIKEAASIGDASYELLNFSQLPRNASVERQVRALKLDREWLENNTQEITARIDYLIQDIERSHGG